MMGQNRKQMLSFTKILRFLFALFAVLMPVYGPMAKQSFLQNEYVVDPLNGVALGGYDAVSYFTEDEPLLGRPEYELEWKNVIWYFSNEANREVFSRAPEIYAPQFGGHGTMGLARGYLSDGNPRVYLILADRLFLFYSHSNKEAFMMSAKSSYIKARNNWEFFSDRFLPAE